MTPGLIPHGNPPRYFTFPTLQRLGLPHATTTRHCPGVTSPSQPTSPFTPAAREVLAAAGLDLSRVAYARQVHGAAAARVTAAGAAGEVDVLVTGERGRPLAVFTADCLAITLWDPDAPALAVAHAGWRGTMKGVVGASVRALLDAGARVERLRVAVAPSIGPCCYEVDEPVIRALSGAYPEAWERWTTPRGPGHWMLDLWRANEEQLAAAGVLPERIENPRLCTACHPELLFSYRKGHRGRLVTVAALP